MRKWFRVVLLAVLIVSLFANALGYNVASAKTAKPQDQVTNFLKSAAKLKESQAAGYWVSEERSSVSSAIQGVASYTKISLSKLKVTVTSQTDNAAYLNATFGLKVTYEKTKVDRGQQQATFTLNNVGGAWLIASSSWDWGTFNLPEYAIYGFIDNVAVLKAKEAASYWIAAEQDNVISRINGITPGMEISIYKLKIVMNSQIGVMTDVSAYYNIKAKVDGKTTVNKKSEKISFTLNTANQKWLIASSDIWGKEPWNGSVAVSTNTPTPKVTPTSIQTPTKYTKILAETRIYYYDTNKADWVTVAPPRRGPAETYEFSEGLARYTTNLDTPGSLVNGVTTLINWTSPPKYFTEGDEISITAKASGRIDVQRQVTPAWSLTEFIMKADGQDVGLPTQVGGQFDQQLAGKETKYTFKTPVSALEYDIEYYVNAGPYREWITFVYHRGEVVIQAAIPDPLIFIPGVTGSQLAAQDGHVLWPPEGCSASPSIAQVKNDFTRLSLNPNTGPHEAIKATDVIRTYGDEYYGPLLDYLVNNGGYVEYQVNGDPARRTAAGFDLSQKDEYPTLFVFAYDWRLSNVDNSKALADYVASINKMYPGKKVNIVAHSMGGLISRRFILDNPGKVNKLITIATPFLGSPKPLYQIIYGTMGVRIWDDLKSLAFNNELKEMMAYYPGVHELLSTRMYFALGGRPYRVIGFSDLGGSDIDYIPLMGTGGIIDKLFPATSYNGKTAAQSNRDFHSYSNEGNNQDDWSNDTTGVNYYHIIGVQKSGDTPMTLQESYPQSPSRPEWHFVVEGPGDGTVPRLSTERIGTDSRNLNAPGAQVFLFTEGDDDLLEHTGLVTNPAVQSKILEVLKAK